MKKVALSLLLLMCSCVHDHDNRKVSSVVQKETLDALVSQNGEECEDLTKLIIEMNTDGYAIEKGGKRIWEYYERYHGPMTPHVLWSASKTLTTTMMGRAVYEGKLKLDTPLNVALADLAKKGLRKSAAQKQMNQIDQDATIETLVTMTYPFQWNEFYESDTTKSTFIPMLYLEERYNMAEYAYSQPYDQNKIKGIGPKAGDKTIYSGGSSLLQQHILKETYGTEYPTLPWKLIFDPLGMKNTRWERDEAGHFVGSSYAYASPRDMLKYGRFYLNDGVAPNGKRLLSHEWIEAAKTVEDSLGSPFTPEVYAQQLGVQSKRVFWLNKPIYKNGKPKTVENRIWPLPESESEKEFPNSPDDMFFAAGHYGQLIIMLPKEDLVIARTGHDLQYWGNIDSLVAHSIKCFGDQ